MRIGIKSQSFGNRLEWLASEQKRHLQNGVILDADKVSAYFTVKEVGKADRKVLPDGMPIGKITATGLYAPIKNTVVTGKVSASATAAIGVVGNNNGITLTAKPGAPGNDVSITLADPAGNDQALAVSVSDTDITVSLATGPAGAITSTAAQVIAAIKASAAAMALLATVANTGASTGAGTCAAVVKTGLEGGTNVATTTAKEPKNLNVGDVLKVGTETVTLTAVDYATGDISWTGEITVELGDVIQTADGSAVAAAILAERADVTDGDGLFGAIDMARVIEARLPIKVETSTKDALKMVTFQ